MWLIEKGIQVQQRETVDDKDDIFYQSLKSARIKAYKSEQEYLFKKRTNSK